MKTSLGNGLLCLLCGIVAVNAALAADPVPPAKPYRPFPEMPEILMYEGFEGATTTWEKGKIDSEVVQAPGNHSLKLNQSEWNKNDDKWLYSVTQFGALKFPGGLDPNNIYVQVMFYAEEIGEIQIKLKSDKVEFVKKEQVARPKTWFPVVFKLSELGNATNRPKADQSLTNFEVLHQPRDKKKYDNAYIDDVCITYGVRPADVMPKLHVLEGKRASVVRTLANHGFNYTMQGNEALKSELKASSHRKKPKQVLVMGTSPTDNETLIKALNAGAQKAKASVFKFVPATLPDNNPIGGIDDMRTFLSYNLQKSEAETVVLVLGYADAVGGGKAGNSEVFRTILERTLQLGCVPIVSLPPLQATASKDDKTKVEGFNNTVMNVCGQMGVPYIDPGFVLKGEKSPPFNANELNETGVNLIGEFAASVVKHVDGLLFK